MEEKNSWLKINPSYLSSVSLEYCMISNTTVVEAVPILLPFNIKFPVFTSSTSCIFICCIWYQVFWWNFHVQQQQIQFFKLQTLDYFHKKQCKIPFFGHRWGPLLHPIESLLREYVSLEIPTFSFQCSIFQKYLINADDYFSFFQKQTVLICHNILIITYTVMVCMPRGFFV